MLETSTALFSESSVDLLLVLDCIQEEIFCREETVVDNPMSRNAANKRYHSRSQTEKLRYIIYDTGTEMN